jgi:hypothetical protein
MSGHEVMAYTFVSGTQCQPKRRKFARVGLTASASDLRGSAATIGGIIIGGSGGLVGGGGVGGEQGLVEAIRIAVPSLSRSPSPVRKEFPVTDKFVTSAMNLLLLFAKTFEHKEYFNFRSALAEHFIAFPSMIFNS